MPQADLLVTPGETRYALIVATSREQALLVLEHARTLVRSSRALSHELVEEGEYQLTFRGNRALLAIPCNARSVRGYAASCVVFDECAHMNDAEVDGPMVASRLWAALTPSVAQFGAFGRIIAISTPSGSAGFFAEMFQKCRGGEIPGAAAFSAPTSANPLIDAEYLQAQEAALGPDDFDREFRAVFTAGGAAYVDAERLRHCVADWQEVLPTEGRDWIASFDPAFSRDAAALAIVGKSHDDPSRFLVGYTQRWLPTRPRRLVRRSREEDTARIEQVVTDVAGVCKRYGLHNVITDQHLSGVMESEFGKHGLRTITSAWTKDSRAAGFPQPARPRPHRPGRVPRRPRPDRRGRQAARETRPPGDRDAPRRRQPLRPDSRRDGGRPGARAARSGPPDADVVRTESARRDRPRQPRSGSQPRRRHHLPRPGTHSDARARTSRSRLGAAAVSMQASVRPSVVESPGRGPLAYATRSAVERGREIIPGVVLELAVEEAIRHGRVSRRPPHGAQPLVRGELGVYGDGWFCVVRRGRGQLGRRRAWRVLSVHRVNEGGRDGDQ